MKNNWLNKISIVTRYQYKWVFIIAICWTLLDLIRLFIFTVAENNVEHPFFQITTAAVAIRIILVFAASLWMGYLIVFKLKQTFRIVPLWLGFAIKALILCIITALFYTLLFFVVYMAVYKYSAADSWQFFSSYYGYHYRAINNSGLWLLIFIITQLIIEINEKYSPGIFKDILLGKYINPKEEKKIILFIDLKDSTSIAEQLGHKKYFLFIRDFIYHISIAILNSDGNIYQYVGDEVVISWPFSEKNCNRCIQALIAARKELQKENNYFRRKYDMIPEFRAGLHCGNVMIGEIGIIKKDLAMSGDPMNTAARIKTATAELNKKFIASKDFIDAARLEEWQSESVGVIELKGKENGLELFYLKI
jgi:adenylate cyclase